MPGTEKDSRPVIQLDAHLDACGFMVQNIQDNGCLGIIMLGGFHLTSLPDLVRIHTACAGKMVHGIICAKPVHFMTTAERSSQTLEIEKMYVDVGATSREEVENVFGIHIGDPMMPDVTFEYDAEHEICFGKAFDNRAGCACIVDTMHAIVCIVCSTEPQNFSPPNGRKAICQRPSTNRLTAVNRSDDGR